MIPGCDGELIDLEGEALGLIDRCAKLAGHPLIGAADHLQRFFDDRRTARIHQQVEGVPHCGTLISRRFHITFFVLMAQLHLQPEPLSVESVTGVMAPTCILGSTCRSGMVVKRAFLTKLETTTMIRTASVTE